MKPAFTSWSRSLLLAGAVSLLPGFSAQAQATSKPPRDAAVVPPPGPAKASPAVRPASPPDPEGAELPASVRSRRLTLDLQQVPLSEVVAHLREQFQDVNFLLPVSVSSRPERGDYSISVSLRNATLRDVLNAIAFATDEEVSWLVSGENLVVFRLRPDLLPRGWGTSAPAEVTAPESNRTIQVINLSQIMRGRKVDERKEVLAEVMALTDATLQRLSEGGTTLAMPDCNYHPGTGVLILVGPERSNRVLLDILRNIDPPATPPPTPSAQLNLLVPPPPPPEAPEVRTPTPTRF